MMNYNKCVFQLHPLFNIYLYLESNYNRLMEFELNLFCLINLHPCSIFHFNLCFNIINLECFLTQSINLFYKFHYKYINQYFFLKFRSQIQIIY